MELDNPHYNSTYVLFYNSGVSGNFVVYNVGESAVLECQFAEDIVAVEMLHGDEVLFSNTSHNAVMEFEVEELLHNKTYICRGTGLNRLQLQYFTLIVQGT